jgi:predicted nucleic acid-binding protein
MAILYFDTSALVKLYIREAGSDFLLTQVHPDAGHRLAILSLARVELRSAVRRRARLGEITADIAQQVIDSLSHHISDVFLVQPVNESVLDTASGLIDRHSLRSYDAIQLAGLISMRDVSADKGLEHHFVCADLQLLAAAAREGFIAVNPGDHV